MTLREYRSRHGLSQQALADLIGVQKSSVSRYETGRVPEEDVMEKVFEVTNGAVTPNDFYDFTRAA